MRTNDTVAQAINSALAPLVASNNYYGNILVAKGNAEIYSESFGKRDYINDVNHDPESRFFLCSGSMIFTSTAILKLVDEGKLSLDDPLSKFLPEFKRSDEITVHHMLAQRSGIPGIGTVGGARRALLLNYTKKPHSAKDLVDYVKNYDLLYEPGQAYNHGKSEYNILAYIIEEISGSTFGDYLRDSIFLPLGMTNTGHYGKDVGQIDFLSEGHTHHGFADLKYADPIHWSSKTGHASIYSTTEDLYKFGRAVLEGRILSEESWDKVFTDYGSSWGYGWGVGSQQGYDRIQINGRSPGFSSYFGIYPSEDLVVIMLSNIYISLPYFVGPQIASIALGEDYEKLNLSTDPVPFDLAEQVVGNYRFGEFYRPGGKVKIRFAEGKLFSDGNPLIPVMEDGEITKFIHRHYWSSLSFAMNEQGEYDQLLFDDYRGSREDGGVLGLGWSQLLIIVLSVVLVLGLTRFMILRRRNQSILS